MSEIKERTLAGQLAYCIEKLSEQLAPPQAVVDGVVLALQQMQPELQKLDEAGAPPDTAKVRVGSKAILKNGDQIMTVIDVNTCLGIVTCAWHGIGGDPFTEKYPDDALAFFAPDRLTAKVDGDLSRE